MNNLVLASLLLLVCSCASVKPDIHTMYMPKGSVLMWEQPDGRVAVFREDERLTFTTDSWEAAGRFTEAGLYWSKKMHGVNVFKLLHAETSFKKEK